MKRKLILLCCVLSICLMFGLAACGEHEHSWGEWRTPVQPTCTEAGIEERVCSGCNQTEEREIAATGHQWSEWHTVTPAGCTNDGQKERTCSVCYETDTNTIPALGHDAQFVEEKPATCNDSGTAAHWNCPNCGQNFADEECTESIDIYLPATGHTYSDEWSWDEEYHWHAATCGHDTTKDWDNHTFVGGKCSVCDYAPDYTVGLEYYIDRLSESCSVSGIGTAEVGDIVIPSSYHDYPVTGISSSAFSGKAITSVTIPASVKYIDDYAFQNCTALQSVTFAEGITEIQPGAFQGCTALETLVIPDSVTLIDTNAFEDCTALTSITLGKGITDIRSYAFSGCTGLTTIIYNITDERVDISNAYTCFAEAGVEGEGITVTFGDSVTVVPDDLFWASSSDINIVCIKFGANVKQIGATAFSDLTSLETIEFAKDGALDTIGYGAFQDCSGLTEITIPATIESIAANAFNGCTGLTSIHYAANAQIGSGSNSVFRNAGSISGCNLTVTASALVIPANLFDNSNITNVTVENGVTSVAAGAFAHCDFLKTVSFSTTVQSIATNAFEDCTQLQSITVADGNEYFQSHDGILYNTADGSLHTVPQLLSGEITIPRFVNEIPESAFRERTGITSVTFQQPASGTLSIGDYAFYGCTKLEELEFPAATSSIGGHAFSGCTELSELNIPGGLQNIGAAAFANCTSLAEITYSSSNLQSFDYDTFYEAGSSAKGITVTFTNTVEHIPSYMFYNVDGSAVNVTSLIIGSNVKSIGLSAFGSCLLVEKIEFNSTSLEATGYGQTLFPAKLGSQGSGLSVIFGENVTKIPERLFPNVDSLTSVVFSGSVHTIGPSAFSGCSNLTDISLPDSLTTIGDSAFSGCSALDALPYGENTALETIGARAFNACTSLTEVFIPSTVTSLGEAAFGGCTALTRVDYRAKLAECSGGDPVFYDSGVEGGFEAVLSDDVYRIPAGLFNDTTLAKVNIPVNVNTIEASAFQKCSSLTDVHYDAANVTNPTTVYDYDTYPFYTAGNGNLKLHIGASVTAFPSDIFMRAEFAEVHLAELEAFLNIKFTAFESNPIYHAKDLYLNDELLTNLIIPEGVTEIGEYQFYNCQTIQSLTLPSSIQAAASSAFYFCKNLTEIHISSLEKWLSLDGIMNNLGAVNLYIGDTLLTDLVIPEGTERIEEGYFTGCVSIQTVFIPASVTRIDAHAFRNCTGLTSVTFEDPDGWNYYMYPNTTNPRAEDFSDPSQAVETLISVPISSNSDYWKKD